MAARYSSGSVALTAVMRKLLVLANALVQQDRIWMPHPPGEVLAAPSSRRPAKWGAVTHDRATQQPCAQTLTLSISPLTRAADPYHSCSEGSPGTAAVRACRDAGPDGKPKTPILAVQGEAAMQASHFRKDDHPRMRRKPSEGFSISALSVAATAILVLSCGDAGVEPPALVATAVTVTPGSATFSALGDTARFTAEVRNQNGHVITGAAVAWTSSHASVAAVDASGQVTAVANGSATITATAGSASGTAAVTVAQAVSAIAVSPASDTLLAFGDTLRLTAEATDANGHAVAAASEFSWASSDTLVARVDTSGQVTAAANGNATITAMSASASGTAAVTVAQVVSAVSVSPAADTLQAFGDTLRLIAEATDAHGHAVAASEFSWTSSDTLVARVDLSGLVESVAEGTAVVTATASDVVGRADLRVVGTACTTYFELTYDDGSTDCIRVPRVVFTFTPRGGRELIESSWDPTEVIKIHFDSEVVYLSESGEWRDITKEDILDMVEISGNIDRTDRVSANGPIDLPLVSVSNVGGRTVLTINSPYDARTWEGKIYVNGSHYSSRYGNNYSIIVANFAKKDDITKIAHSNSVSSYLEDTKTFYHGEFGAQYYNASSCDIEHRPSTASYAQYSGQYGDGDAVDLFAGEIQMSSFLPEGVSSDGSTSSVASELRELEKADPATRYVIDIAFVVAESLLESASGDWRGNLRNDFLGHVNKIFQDSGVNVEFRASVISPFSEYRQYLLCDLPTLDNLVVTRRKQGDSYGWSNGEAYVLTELIPSIRRKDPADIVIAMLPGGGGYASNSAGLAVLSPYVVSRWGSWAVLRSSREVFDGNSSLGRFRKLAQILTLAHELGHLLGLHHDIDSLVEDTGLAPDILTRPGTATVTGFGYGYGGSFSDRPYGTMMASGPQRGIIPLFSSDREVVSSELCSDRKRIHIVWNIGYCISGDPEPNTPIRLGGLYKYGITVDATEALQYTIGYASAYSEAGVAPLDLSTVSNSVTAKTMRAGH